MLRKLEKKQDEFDEVLDTKVDIEDHQDVKELILKLPKVEDVERQNRYVTDNIEKFKADNKLFHSEYIKHNEIIRRYDEVLSSKASRMAFKEQSLEIEAKFKKYEKEVNIKFDKMHRVSESHSNKLEDLRSLLNTEIDSRIAKQFKKER